MNWRDFIKDYLTFTRKERIGVLVIAGLMVFVLLLPEILAKSSKRNVSEIDTTWIAAVKKLEFKHPDTAREYFQNNNEENAITYQYDKRKSNYSENDITKAPLFYFDPNTVSTAGWKRLGLRDRTIQTIEKYVSKGGHFYKPDDLQKIYGLRAEEYERLEPYIKIESKTSATNELVTWSKPKEELQATKIYASRYSVIDINIADTSAFISLPGIGSKLAARIVNFREKLGGFYSLDQVGEIYGLPDSTFQKIKQYLKLENASVRKININIASIDEMKAHPYIKYSLANPIIAYRNEHGSFSKIEDVKKVMAITDDIYKKIAPYLTIE